MATIFTRIAKGEIPSYKCAESEDYYAFPKNVEDDYIFNLDDDTYAGLCAFAKKVAVALKNAVPCKRVGVAVLGMEVPHTHIHLVPLQKESDMAFGKHVSLTPEQMKQTADAIFAEFSKIK